MKDPYRFLDEADEYDMCYIVLKDGRQLRAEVLEIATDVNYRVGFVAGDNEYLPEEISMAGYNKMGGPW